MKKRIAAALAASFVMGVAGVAFANPFSDVPNKHWSYDAVNKLAKAGIVTGYADNTYQGDKTMTRYEMAQMVANAITKTDKADAEQKALIAKLQAEYADELGALDARLTAVEKKQGNVAFYGNTRVRYENTDNGVDKADAAPVRLRLWAEGQVTEDWSVVARFQATETMTSNEVESNTDVNHLYAKGKLGVVDARVGLHPVMPAYGALLDVSVKGATLGLNSERGSLNLTYGKFDGNSVATSLWEKDADNKAVKLANTDKVDYLGANVKFPVSSRMALAAAYHNFDNNTNDADVLETGLAYKLSKNYVVKGAFMKADGDYTKIFNETTDDQSWFAGLWYKGANTNNVGSFGAWGVYSDYGFGWDSAFDNNESGKTTEFGVAYVPAKNIKWTTQYFNCEDSSATPGADVDKIRTQVELFF